jgi:hypothetical protein
MKPSIGRIVHYVPLSGRSPHQAAIAVGIYDGIPESLLLQVFRNSDHGSDLRGPVEHEERALAGTWHWPEREEETVDRGGAA